MAFTTKIEFSDNRLYQPSGTTMTLSGITNIDNKGTLQYVEAPTINTPLKLPHAGYVTGLTAAISNRLTIVEDKYITGTTNGLGLANKEILLGGGLDRNTYINGNYELWFGTTGSTLSKVKTYTTDYLINVTPPAQNPSSLIINANITLSPGGYVYLTKRATYSEDFSSSFQTNDLVSKKYVDDAALSGATVSLNETYVFSPEQNDERYDIPSGKTTPYYVFVDNSGNKTDPSIQLPSSPLNNQIIRVKDASSNANTYRITINRNTKNINNSTSDYQINTSSGSVELMYISSLNSWYTMAVVN